MCNYLGDAVPSNETEQSLEHVADGRHLVALLRGVVRRELPVDVHHAAEVLVVPREPRRVDRAALAWLEDDNVVRFAVPV